MSPERNPLTDGHRRQIDTALRGLQEARALIEKCKACGLDVGEHCSDCSFLDEQLNAIKKAFFSIGE